MKFLRIKYAVAAVSLLTVSIVAQAQNNLVDAVMKVYAEELAANPRDYHTYYSRAMVYFNQGKMDEALSDVDNSIKYFPRKEKADLSQAYALRGKILAERGENKLALRDFDSSLELLPGYRPVLLDRANLLVKMGEYDRARSDYNQVLRGEPRNQDAYMGLARIEANMGQSVRAKDLLAQAVNLSPRNPHIYLERAEVYKQLNMMPEAVDDLIYAISLGGGQSDAITQLVLYGRDSYSGVIEGLNRNIARDPNNSLLYYVRGFIFYGNNDFRSSLQDWNKLLDDNKLNYHLAYYNRANCLFHLGRFEEARADIKVALEQESENVEYNCLLSEVERELGNLQAADEAIRQAAIYDPSSVRVCLDRGMIAYAEGNIDEAIKCYDEAVAAAPHLPYPYMMRAFAQESVENIIDANIDYRKVVALDDTAEQYSENLKGIASMKLGQQSEAEAWERMVLMSGAVRNIDYFYFACMYAPVDADKAIDYLEQAIQSGFSDYYRIHLDRYSALTVEPIRHLPRYNDLLQKYRTALGQ